MSTWSAAMAIVKPALGLVREEMVSVKQTMAMAIVWCHERLRGHAAV
jgi:hypothetical protein